MVKSVLGVNHQGLTDWFFQRVSAVVMGIYFVGLMVFFLMHPDVTYEDWHGLFSCGWMKVATILVVISLLFHAWVGMWTVFTDYIKCAWARLILEVLVFFGLAACFFAAFAILWGI